MVTRQLTSSSVGQVVDARQPTSSQVGQVMDANQLSQLRTGAPGNQLQPAQLKFSLLGHVPHDWPGQLLHLQPPLRHPQLAHVDPHLLNVDPRAHALHFHHTSTVHARTDPGIYLPRQ